MNPHEFHRKLIAMARATPPDGRVPYAFEQRIMARLRTAQIDVWTAWSSLLWRAAIPSICVMIAASAFARFTALPHDRETAELESTLLAPVTAAAETESW
jgi:hypothetical protein